MVEWQRMIFDFEKSRGVNKGNLIGVEIKKDRHVNSRSNNLSVGLANVRSVKNKDNF